MMLLFTEQNAELILGKAKTQTRRIATRLPRWKVGAIHRCYTRPPFTKGGAKPFAKVRILSVWPEYLYDISIQNAQREGYSGTSEFFNVWKQIHGDLADIKVWAIEFELVESLRDLVGAA